MEVQQVLCMKRGDGEASYANNSLLQKKVILEVKPILEESITELYCNTFPECLKIADLGCSSGPNTFLPLWEIIDCIGATCSRFSREPPAFQIFLNDLPQNDFNAIFKSLARFYERIEKEKEGMSGQCFIAGVPGSFHRRLFPDRSIHFVHSSYSLHWLSQVPEGLVSESGTPLNKGNIHLTVATPPSVHKAYLNQFERDFTAFLRLRSQEIIHGGHMLLTLLGSDGNGQNSSTDRLYNICELISITLKDMVTEKKVILEVKPMLEESITELYCTTFPECLKIADLGCSSGPNTLLPLWEIVECIGRSCVRLSRKPPMFQVFLNDLPHNDFNSIFRSLGSFYEKLEKEKEGGKFGECLIAGMPGSFHKRLFPDHSIHFVHSSYGLHWLSQVPEGLVSESGTPLNKGNIHIAETSPPGVHGAYLNQFERDFTAFLKLRSQEIIPGGRMLLTLLGSEPKHFCKIWELISTSLNDLVIEGFVQESKLDQCNIPLYMPTAEEVKDVVQREGSFNLLRLETFRLDWDAHIDDGNKDLVFDRFERAKYVVMGMRAVAEPLLISHFGDRIMDNLFHRFFMKVADDIEAGKDICINHIMSLTKV